MWLSDLNDMEIHETKRFIWIGYNIELANWVYYDIDFSALEMLKIQLIIVCVSVALQLN